MASHTQTDVPPELEAAMATLRTDPAAAREKTRAALTQPSPDPRYWVVAGHAAKALEDWEDLEKVADGLLEVAPNAILGLIWKADAVSQSGSLREASSIYMAALRAASEAGELPEATIADLRRVEREIQEIQRTYGWHLEEHLRSKGFAPETTSEAFREAFATLIGMHQPEVDLQRPTVLYYPGLPQRPYYETGEFEWAADLEAATADIRAEFDAARTGTGSLQPVGDDAEASQGADTAHLSALELWSDGTPVEENLARCPKTNALIEQVTRPQFAHRAPIAAFWRLAPATRVLPRHGMFNSRLIAHLPLIVSEGCGLAVNGEQRPWEIGKLVIFDDSIEHEIWNEGDSEAVALLFDIARPEIDGKEMAAITALFEGVDSFD